MGNGPGGLAGAEEAGAGVQVSGAGDPESGQRGGADARQAQMGSRALPAPQPLQVHKGPGPQAGVHRAAHAARAWTPCPRPPPWRASRHLRARVLASCSPAHLRLGRRAPQPAGRAHGIGKVIILSFLRLHPSTAFLTLLLSTRVPFPNKISCFVSTCVSLDNSFLSVRSEPSLALEGAPLSATGPPGKPTHLYRHY